MQTYFAPNCDQSGAKGRGLHFQSPKPSKGKKEEVSLRSDVTGRGVMCLRCCLFIVVVVVVVVVVWAGSSAA